MATATVTKPAELEECPACGRDRETALVRDYGAPLADANGRKLADPPKVERCVCGYVYGPAADAPGAKDEEPAVPRGNV